MENNPNVLLGSLEGPNPSAESDFTDGLDSSAELDFDIDDDYEGTWENSSGSLDEDESDPVCSIETLRNFTYKNEGEIYADGHAIRLLQLLGGTGPIQARLFRAFLHNAGNGLMGVPYEALSYTWGSSETTKQIVLNGDRFMVTENLYSTLQYLRFEDEDRILWIDAICINQGYIMERNHQVSHMASIYRDAERVLFWLGEPTDDTDVLVSSLVQLQALASEMLNNTRENAHDLRLKTVWDEKSVQKDVSANLRGLELLLRRPWFKRSWILQEVCFAQTGLVICGKRSVAAQIFALAPWLLNLRLEAHCKAVLDMMPGATRSTPTFLSGSEMRNFYSLLRRFYRSEASDPRDQIYALLGMATDADAAGFPRVDYGKGFEDVVSSTFAYLFPSFWNKCGRSHGYQCLSEFVEDFPRLREAEIQDKDEDVLLMTILSDDTEATQLHPQRLFQRAVQTGDAQILSDLLRFSNINVNEMYHSYQVEAIGEVFTCQLPPLCAAAACGFVDVVRQLAKDLRLNDINSVDILYKRTALSWAAMNGHEAVVKLLLATGKVIVDVKDKLGRTPLHWAIENEHEATMKLLLVTDESGVNSKDGSGRTPLSRAAINGHEAVVRLLLTSSKAIVDLKDNFGRTPLSWAAMNGHEAVVKQLIAAGQADVDVEDNFGRTPLSWAAMNGHDAVINLLLETGKATVGSKDDYNQTPLSRAAENGHTVTVKLLLATNKAGIDVKDNSGRTPLLRAAINGHETVVYLLLATGKATIDFKDESGRTPLSWAAMNGHGAVVKLLLATSKATVDIRDDSGQTPLSWASMKGHEDVATLLLAIGKATVDIEDESGRTPLSWAAVNGHEAMVKLLLAEGEA